MVYDYVNQEDFMYFLPKESRDEVKRMVNTYISNIERGKGNAFRWQHIGQMLFTNQGNDIYFLRMIMGQNFTKMVADPDALVKFLGLDFSTLTRDQLRKLQETFFSVSKDRGLKGNMTIYDSLSFAQKIALRAKGFTREAFLTVEEYSEEVRKKLENPNDPTPHDIALIASNNWKKIPRPRTVAEMQDILHNEL
jgi:hypothetical protein